MTADKAAAGDTKTESAVESEVAAGGKKTKSAAKAAVVDEKAGGKKTESAAEPAVVNESAIGNKTESASKSAPSLTKEQIQHQLKTDWPDWHYKVLHESHDID